MSQVLFRQLMVRKHTIEFWKMAAFLFRYINRNSNILVCCYLFWTDLNYSLYSDVFSERERFLLRPNDSLVNSLNRSLESQLILLKPNEQTFVNVSLTLGVSFISTLKYINHVLTTLKKPLLTWFSVNINHWLKKNIFTYTLPCHYIFIAQFQMIN